MPQTTECRRRVPGTEDAIQVAAPGPHLIDRRAGALQAGGAGGSEFTRQALEHQEMKHRPQKNRYDGS